MHSKTYLRKNEVRNMLIEVLKIKDEISKWDRAYINSDQIMVITDYNCGYLGTNVGMIRILMSTGYELLIAEDFENFVARVESYTPNEGNDFVSAVDSIIDEIERQLEEQ